MSLETTPNDPPAQPVDEPAMARAMERLERELGVDTSSRLAMAKASFAGLNPKVLDRLREFGLKSDDLNWIVKPRTLSHRKLKHELLTTEETGRLIRAARVQYVAQEVFGDKERAQRWLHKPNPNFDGLSALELTRTEEGAALVIDTLNQIDSGFAA